MVAGSASDPAYMRNPGVNATEIDAETFLVDPSGSEVFYLDEISSALWRLIEQPRRRSEIIRVFAAAFPDIPGRQIEADVDRALRDLETRELASRTG